MERWHERTRLYHFLKTNKLETGASGPVCRHFETAPVPASNGGSRANAPDHVADRVRLRPAPETASQVEGTV